MNRVLMSRDALKIRVVRMNRAVLMTRNSRKIRNALMNPVAPKSPMDVLTNRAVPTPNRFRCPARCFRPGRFPTTSPGLPIPNSIPALKSPRIPTNPALAPAHVAHIKRLVGEGFYDGIVFHRVIDGFMAQTGCPKGTGTGGSKYPDVKAEFNAEPHVRGTVSMARAASPDSANSQFFICFADAPFLDRKYTVWGKVVSGMENVDKIKRGEPVRDPDKIVKASLS